jgi:hypothetical protein
MRKYGPERNLKELTCVLQRKGKLDEAMYSTIPIFSSGSS